MAAVADASPAATAVREASALVAQAISKLAALGADAPMTVREALGPLGCAYGVLGYSDPATAHSIPREDTP